MPLVSCSLNDWVTRVVSNVCSKISNNCSEVFRIVKISPINHFWSCISAFRSLSPLTPPPQRGRPCAIPWVPAGVRPGHVHHHRLVVPHVFRRAHRGLSLCPTAPGSEVVSLLFFLSPFVFTFWVSLPPFFNRTYSTSRTQAF